MPLEVHIQGFDIHNFHAKMQVGVVGRDRGILRARGVVREKGAGLE